MKSHDDSKTDRELKAFLTMNAPVAPAASPGEFERIQSALGLDGPKQQAPPRVFAWGGAGALAASFAASWFLLSGPNPPSTSIHQTSEEWAIHVLTGDQDDEAVPTNEVGEEYLGLLAGR